MKNIPQYKFHQTKYGEELLIDVVTLDNIKRYIDKTPIHTLTYYDITFVIKGTGLFSINNRQYVLNPGDVIFSKPGEVREWHVTPHGYALIFEEEFLLSFFNDPTFIRNLSYFSANRELSKINIANIYARIEYLILNIVKEINHEQSKDKHVLRAMLYEALMLLNREYKTDTATPEIPLNRYIDKFIKLVDRDFKMHHDTRYYADQICLSPNYLNEIVQKFIGVSPKCYIQNKIIQEAKILLSYTDKSIAEVAETLHFESPSYFIRLFRSHTKQSPLEYRHSRIR